MMRSAVWGMLIAAIFQAGPHPPLLELLPAKEGVYIWRGADGWEQVYRAVLDEQKSKGLERFLQTDGQIALNLTLTFTGTNSPVQIVQHRPEFYVHGIKAGDDTLIVRLESKNDSRQARTSSALVGTSNREGFRRDDIRRLRTTRLSKDLITVIPQEDLKSGEYLLVFGRVADAFDFGIRLP